MKTFDQIAHEVSMEIFNKKAAELLVNSNIFKVYSIAAKRYAEQALDEAAEKADNVITRNQILSIKQIL